MKLAVVIPTRGDRPEFLKQCISYMERQTRKPDHVIIIDRPATSSSIDLAVRYKEGFAKAFDLYKCDLAVCIEDDDWYDDHYVAIMEAKWQQYGKPDVFGINHTLYYNIITNQYVHLNHHNRASMMSTVVGPKIMGVEWCADDYAYLDWHLWTKAANVNKIAINTPMICVGIKHGVGICGGGGHTLDWKNYNKEDKDWLLLSGLMQEKDLEFYKSIKNEQT